MKDPDINEFLPIDKIKVLSNDSIYELETDLGSIVCRINNSKINYEKIDSLSFIDQKEAKITVEKVTDLHKFKTLNFKEGFEDFQIALSKIGTIKIFVK